MFHYRSSKDNALSCDLHIGLHHRVCELLLDELNEIPGKLLIFCNLHIHFDSPSRYDVARIMNLLRTAGLIQYVSSPTHRGGHILDVVIAREDENLLCSVQIDPCLLISCRTQSKKQTLPSKPISFPKFCNLHNQRFSADLSSKLSGVQMTDDLNKFISDADNIIKCVLDEHAPICSRKSMNRHCPKWCNDDVDAARREKRRAERKWRKALRLNPASDPLPYHEAKTLVASAVSDSKQAYYHDIFERSSPKDMFKAVNELLNKNKRVLPNAESSVELASAFCSFFTDKVRNIRKCIDDLNVHASVLGLVSAKPNTKLSSFNRVTFSNLEDVIRKLPDKTCSLDPLPTWLLKKHIPVLMPIILETVNSSLESGTFPSCLGQATVTPVLKKQSLNKDSLCNYRPISNIRFFAKVLEKVVAHQLHEYIDLNHLDNPRQSAYKKNYSTETALLSLQNDISRALDDKKATFLLSLDLSAVFDTLDHAILTERLHTHFGLSGFALQWFVSYIQNRTCSVAIDNSDSP